MVLDNFSDRNTPLFLVPAHLRKYLEVNDDYAIRCGTRAMATPPSKKQKKAVSPDEDEIEKDFKAWVNDQHSVTLI